MTAGLTLFSKVFLDTLKILPTENTLTAKDKLVSEWNFKRNAGNAAYLFRDILTDSTVASGNSSFQLSAVIIKNDRRQSFGRCRLRSAILSGA